jgi:hypothetical protein
LEEEEGEEEEERKHDMKKGSKEAWHDPDVKVLVG